MTEWYDRHIQSVVAQLDIRLQTGPFWVGVVWQTQSKMVHTREVTTKFNHIQVNNHLYAYYNLKNVIVQWQRSKVRESVTLQEYQGFHMFSEIVLFFFDLLVTGGTYANLDQNVQKKLKKIFCVHSATFQK